MCAQVQERGISIGKFKNLLQNAISGISDDSCDKDGINAFVKCCMEEGKRIGLTEPATP